MGCDIHMHIEVKIRGKWHHYSAPRISRNYELFARMANVRNFDSFPINPIKPIAEPRGFPDDATVITRLDNDLLGEDGHSHSWLNSEEFSALIKWYEELYDGQLPPRTYISWEYQELGYLFGNGWDRTDDPECYPKGLQDVRVIFWFDN